MKADDLRQLNSALILCDRAARVFETLMADAAALRPWLAHTQVKDEWATERRMRKGLIKALALGWPLTLWRTAPGSSVVVQPGYYPGVESVELGIDVTARTQGLARQLRKQAQSALVLPPPWVVAYGPKVIVSARTVDRGSPVDESVSWLLARLTELNVAGWLDQFGKTGNEEPAA